MSLTSETQNVNAMLNIGRHALKKCDYEKALQYFSRALELDPQNQLAVYFTKKMHYRLQQATATMVALA